MARFQPGGLVYRYVLESDRTPQELNDRSWVVERAYRSVHGVAVTRGSAARRCNTGFCSIRARYGCHLTIPPHAALATTTQMRWLLFAGRTVLLRSQHRPGKEHENIGNVVVSANKGVPIQCAISAT
jgi:hypothetical protein